MASGWESERSLAARREQRRREREALLAQVGGPARLGLPGPRASCPALPCLPGWGGRGVRSERGHA